MNPAILSAVALLVTVSGAALTAEAPAAAPPQLGKASLEAVVAALSFALDARSLASFDPAASAWVAEAGRYEVKLGASSADIRQSDSFTLAKSLVVRKEARALVPREKIVEIRPPARQ